MPYRVLIPDAVFDDRCEIERLGVEPGIDFHFYREWPAERVPLRILRTCDALVCYGSYPLPGWTAGLLEHCRIVVRTPAGLAHTHLPAFGERGIPVCTPTPLRGARTEPVQTAATVTASVPTPEIRREAAATVALFLCQGFLRNCVNARWLRLGELRLASVSESRDDRPRVRALAL